MVGFELSECNLLLQQTLFSKGYIYSQFILTPTELGIPNERPRYYCIARLQAGGVRRTESFSPQGISAAAAIISDDKGYLVTRTLSDYLDETYDVSVANFCFINILYCNYF